MHLTLADSHPIVRTGAYRRLRMRRQVARRRVEEILRANPADRELLEELRAMDSEEPDSSGHEVC